MSTMEETKTAATVSRRGFLGGVGAEALGASALGLGLLGGCAPQPRAAEAGGETAAPGDAASPALSQTGSAASPYAQINPQDWDFTTNSIEDFANTTMFSKLKIGSLTLKNRLIKSAASSMVPNEEQKAVAYHGRIAAGGMGAVLVEGSYIMLERLDKRVNVADNDMRMTIEESPLAAICAEVHSHDVPCLIQMKMATPGIVYLWENMGEEGETHKASLLSAADIQMYIEDTIDGAARLQAIGFDGIDEIRPCCRCLNCLGGLCRVNPCNNSVFTDAMPEGYEVRPADGDKNVMVIGGGPAGMEAARVAAERGYAVTLYEKNGLGGLLDFAEMVKGKHESLGRLRNYLSHMLEVEGVAVVTGQEVDAAFVREQSPDVVIVATGGVRPELAASGSSATPVIGITDFLANEIGERVAVLGFNAQATDTAHYLIAQGKKVTVVAPEPAEAFGGGQSMMLNAFVKPAFFAAGGRLMPECTLKSVGDGEIIVTNSFGMDVALACDCVVDASTMSPNTALADELSSEFDVHVIGDAAEPSSIQNAITTGNLTARNC